PVNRSAGALRVQLPPMERAAVDFEMHVFASIGGSDRNLAIDPLLRRRVEDEGFKHADNVRADGVGYGHRGQVAEGIGQIESLPGEIDADAFRLAALAIPQNEGLIQGEESIREAHADPGEADELLLERHVCYRGGAGGV